ncbi:inositol monophosphatase family protein [Actinokineospora spheciospongiae]|uniref:inositol monophosphatase family protein n=1 Tax=Actinokineospora spheciospongiae TaxID=909613 RepID=UPI000D985183|nr:inositol monophosphatase family protein [Actinokineospora spheciospongiae]PWW60367.1 histidinol-phosphatase [Actinokineospora spheciospongiae]
MDEYADLMLANELVARADSIALRHFRGRNPVRTKVDGSPVSEADLTVERAMLDLLRRERPGDAVLSEECGALGDSRRRWVLDPIDGTIPFLRGARDWGTHVALEVDGELVLGLLSRPTEGRVYWARRGHGAHVRENGARRRLHVHGGGALGSARVTGFLFDDSPVRGDLEALPGWTRSPVSAVGDLLEGRLDALVDEGGKVWDRAPAALLVREAGGRVDDLRGGARLDLPWLVYSTPGLGTGITDFLVDRLSRRDVPGRS